MTSKTLEERVKAFQILELPGQPQSMHVGTYSLVTDLLKPVKELEAAIPRCKEEK